MFFRRRIVIPVTAEPVAPFVHQLSEEELKQRELHGITPLGAGFNINLIKKEDTLMVEKLTAYRAELEAKRFLLEGPIDTSEIEVEVAAYREKLIAEAEAKRAAEVTKLNSDIDCINGLIAREEAAAATVVETPVDNVTE